MKRKQYVAKRLSQRIIHDIKNDSEYVG